MTPARRRIRLKDPLRYERDWWEAGVLLVAGVDEVGRGPLAGPVVAAAVILPQNVFIEGVSDSKMVPPEQRVELAVAIREAALAWGVGAGSAREIDRFGLTVGTRLALQRALAHLALPPGHVVLDGRPVKELGWPHKAVVKADYRVHCVACASILAKVCRDALMDRLHPRHPEYGWIHNKGYATDDHRAALARYGPSAHHRKSFEGVMGGLGVGEGGPVSRPGDELVRSLGAALAGTALTRDPAVASSNHRTPSMSEISRPSTSSKRA